MTADLSRFADASVSMNPVRAIKTAYAALCVRFSDTSDRLVQQNDDRLKRLAAYDARYPKGGAQGHTDSDRP